MKNLSPYLIYSDQLSQVYPASHSNSFSLSFILGFFEILQFPCDSIVETLMTFIAYLHKILI